MFGIGLPELILIAVVALLVVGPKNLPVTLRAIGRGIREFQKASRELRAQAGFDEVVDEVTRPLREGLAGIEAETLAARVERVDTRMEYPDGGPDDYGALPENAVVYPGGDNPATPVPLEHTAEGTLVAGHPTPAPTAEPASDGGPLPQGEGVTTHG